MDKEKTCAFSGKPLDPNYPGWSVADEERYQEEARRFAEQGVVNTDVSSLTSMQEAREEHEDHVKEQAWRDYEELMRQAAEAAHLAGERGCMEFCDMARYWWKQTG